MENKKLIFSILIFFNSIIFSAEKSEACREARNVAHDCIERIVDLYIELGRYSTQLDYYNKRDLAEKQKELKKHQSSVLEKCKCTNDDRQVNQMQRLIYLNDFNLNRKKYID